jgi:hypothetical protein
MLYTNLSGAITALIFCAVIHPLPALSRIIRYTPKFAMLFLAILGTAWTLRDVCYADDLANQHNTGMPLLAYVPRMLAQLAHSTERESNNRQSESI